MPVSRCGCGGSFHYQETRFRNEELKVMGSPDGRLIRCPGDPTKTGMGIVEIKSIEGGLFKSLKEPNIRHCFQAQVYMWLTGLKWATILYVSKSLEKKSPFLDYGILYDHKMDQIIRSIVSEIRAGGKKKCITPDDKRAARCPVREACFFAIRK